jgi:hypothetical protein
MTGPFRMTEQRKCAECGMRYDPNQTEAKCPHKSRVEAPYLAELRAQATNRPADVPLIVWLAGK